MHGPDIAIVVGGAALVAFLWWFFFGPKRSSAASVVGGAQEVAITVKGGYSPSVIRVTEGVPLRLVFDRQEAGDCTSRVVFSDFGVSKSLPAFGTATLEFTPDEVGRFDFTCGMNMVHGTLVVEPDDDEVRDLDRDDVAAARNRCEEGIVAEAAEILGEPLQIVVTQRLAGKGEDMMVEPRRADVGHDAGHPEICGRCTSNLYGSGEARTHA